MSSSNNIAKKIILYDFPSKIAGGTMSPNTWKARLALNIKGIPYRTVWVPLPSITAHCISIGATPTSYKVNPIDGSKKPLYTLPVIKDPNTGAVISDSYNIAKYLDENYPGNGIEFVPDGTAALLAAFSAIFTEKIIFNVLPLVISHIAANIRDQDYRFWKDTRPERLGRKVEDIIPASEEAKAAVWKRLVDGFTMVGGWLAENDGGSVGQFVMGERMSWGDVLIETWLLLMRRFWGVDDERWMELMKMGGGRWKRFMESMEKYVYVDEEGKASFNLDI